MSGTVLVFEGQGATTVPGGPGRRDLDLTALPPSAAQQAIVRHQLGRAAEARRQADTDGAPLVGVLGQSLGELSALVVAGAVDEDDALELVRLRAELPGKVLPEQDWTMASMTRLPVERAEQAALGRDLWVVGRNGAADCIVVGHREAFDAFVADLGVSPNTYRLLPVVAPYHTPVMAPVAAEIAAAAAACSWRDPQVPVLTPTGPGEVTSGAEAAALVATALTSPVAWRDVLETAATRWPDARWRECGPTASLHRFVWKNGLTLDWGEA